MKRYKVQHKIRHGSSFTLRETTTLQEAIEYQKAFQKIYGPGVIIADKQKKVLA